MDKKLSIRANAEGLPSASEILDAAWRAYRALPSHAEQVSVITEKEAISIVQDQFATSTAYGGGYLYSGDSVNLNGEKWETPFLHFVNQYDHAGNPALVEKFIEATRSGFDSFFIRTSFEHTFSTTITRLVSGMYERVDYDGQQEAWEENATHPLFEGVREATAKLLGVTPSNTFHQLFDAAMELI